MDLYDLISAVRNVRTRFANTDLSYFMFGAEDKREHLEFLDLVLWHLKNKPDWLNNVFVDVPPRHEGLASEMMQEIWDEAGVKDRVEWDELVASFSVPA